MKLREFYSCALSSPRDEMCLQPDTGIVSKQNPTQEENIRIREVLAKTLESEIKAGTLGLQKALEDLRVNNRDDPLTGAIIDGYRLKFRNTEGFRAVAGMPVENDAYFSHEARYGRSYLKATGQGNTGSRIIRWKRWLKTKKVRILQNEVMQIEAKSRGPDGKGTESERLRASIKSYDKIWKALCRGKRSRFTRKKEWAPLYQGDVLVKDGELRNLAVRVLASKLSDECKLLSARERLGGKNQRAQEKLRRQIGNDHATLQSLIDDCKIDAKNSEPVSAISLRTLDIAATAIDLHAIATEKADRQIDGAGSDNFIHLLGNVYNATHDEANAQRTVRNLHNLDPAQSRRRSWVQQRRDNVSLRRDLRQACQDSGFFDEGFLTRFWTKHHEEFLGKDAGNANALQIKAFIDGLGKEAASKGMLLDVKTLHRKMVIDENAPPELAMEAGTGYADLEDLEAPGGHAIIRDQLNKISADAATSPNSPWLKPNAEVNGFEMRVLGRAVPINKEDINAIEARIAEQYITRYGLVPLGNDDKAHVHENVLMASPPMLACLDYLEEKHELVCENILKNEMDNTHTLLNIFGTGNPATDEGLQQLISDRDKTDLEMGNRLHNHLMQGFRAAYEESESPLSEFVSKEALVEKLQMNLPNLRDVPHAHQDDTKNQVNAYRTLLCADIPEIVFENAISNLPRMRGALRTLENPEKQLEERLSALAKVEIIFKEVENTNVVTNIFLDRPGTSTGDRPGFTEPLPSLVSPRDDFDTTNVQVDHEMMARELQRLRGAQKQFPVPGDQTEPEPWDATVRSKPQEPENFGLQQVNDPDSDEEGEVIREYYPAPENTTTASATTRSSDDQPKGEFARLKGDALRLRLMTVFSDLSRIVDDTHLFVGERRKEAGPIPQAVPTNARRPAEPPAQITPSPLDRQHTDPAVQLEGSQEIAPAPLNPSELSVFRQSINDTENDETSPTAVGLNDFQKEVGAIRAVVRARSRAVRLQRELAHRRKTTFESNQPYEIHGADGQPVDTRWLDNLAGLVRVGQIVSTVNNAPSQLVSAFTHPPGVESPDIEPRNLADKKRLAEHFKERTFNDFIR